MLESEVRRITGRRGTYWSSIAVGFLTVLTVVIVRFFQGGDEGGTDLLNAADAMSLPATVMAVIVGAMAGSYDASEGTMRYLVMTGVPRVRLYINRVLGTAIATVACCLPAVILLVIAAFLLQHRPIHDASAADVLGATWAYVANPLIFALVSVGVGSLLRSNGAAIGISLGFALGGAVIAGVIASQVSQTLANYLLTLAADIVAQINGTNDMSLGVAVAAVLVWLAAFLGAGLWRTLHDEY